MLLFAVGPYLIPNFLVRTIHTHLWPTPVSHLAHLFFSRRPTAS